MLCDHQCRVVENRAVSDALWVIVFESQTPFACLPGQFVMIDLPEDRWFFRRPMSVLSVDETKKRFSVFYRVVGQGTNILARLQLGTHLNVLGPLGNSFTPPQNPDKAILIGGGIGIAPLYWLAYTLHASGLPVPHCYYGVRSAQDVGLDNELASLLGSRLQISTDDGSLNFKGNVCGLLQQDAETIRSAETAYICGPTKMMQASCELLTQLNPGIKTEVSLEEHMPCGTGACGGCVVFRADDKLPSKVCVEGPVFDASVLYWGDALQGHQKEASSCLR